MRPKKRYVLLKSHPDLLPPNSKFLFQNARGFVVKTDIRGAQVLRKNSILISGSIWKLKQPQLLNLSKKKTPRDEVNRRPRLIPD
ncbi:MAG: hypothetical protein OK439_04190 [Thaumarchaeota archaeon]|nr:hypothetical protein [Nitrososphaerota archaeon]